MTNLNHCRRCKKDIPKKKVFCNAECHQLYRKENITFVNCTECGNPVTRAPKHLSRVGNVFCGRKCRDVYMSKGNHHAYKKELHGNCITCGAYLKRANSTYCSNKCTPKGENSPRYSRLTVKCNGCDNKITRQKSHINKTNFCSDECQNNYHSKRLSGKNNPRYKHGKWKGLTNQKLIYNGFTLKTRKEVRARDGNKCMICDMTKEEHKMNLHVHHIDYDKDNNSLDNLISVCRYCHGKIHGDEELWLKILLKK